MQADLSYDLLLESGIRREAIDAFLDANRHESGSDSEGGVVRDLLPKKATSEEKIANRRKNSVNIANTIETLSRPLDEILVEVENEARIIEKETEMLRLLSVKQARIMSELSSSYLVSFEGFEGGKMPMLYLESKHSKDYPGAAVTIRPLEEVEKERGHGAELFKRTDSLVTITEKSSGNIITLGGDLNRVAIRHLINELNFKDLNHYFTPSRESEGLGASSGGAYGGGGEASAGGGPASSTTTRTGYDNSTVKLAGDERKGGPRQ